MLRNNRHQLKPPRLEQKSKLELTFNTLQTRLRLHNRPAYLPSEGAHPLPLPSLLSLTHSTAASHLLSSPSQLTFSSCVRVWLFLRARLSFLLVLSKCECECECACACEGKLVSDIAAAWKDLEGSEKDFEVLLTLSLSVSAHQSLSQLI